MDLSEVRNAGARHPWERARATAIERILRAEQVRPRTLLDYGCGDGFTGERVRNALGATELLGFDIELSSSQCRQMSKEQVTYTNDWASTDHGRFDLGLLCDVIEHVEDDSALLSVVRQRLTEHGYLLITVPAFQSLFTGHDRALRHLRRYTLGQLERVITGAGFELRASGYLFGGLLLGRGVAKLLETSRPKADPSDFGIGAWRGSRVTSAAIESVLNWDNSLLLSLAARGIKLPGLSAWGLCKQRPS